MKLIHGIFTLIFVFLTTVLSFAQMQDVEWKNLPSPSVGTETIEGKLSSLEITEDGQVYFVFLDQNNGILRFKKLDVLNNQWVQFHSVDLSGQTTFQLVSYPVQNQVYVSISNQDFPNSVSTWRINPNNTVDLIINDVGSVMDVGDYMDFVVDKNTLMMYLVTTDMNSEMYVEVFDLTSGTFLNNFMVGHMNLGPSNIAIDYANNELTTFAKGYFTNYQSFVSPIQATLNFTAVNTNGELTSALFTGNAIGNKFELNEKKNGKPTVIFNHDETNAATYRLGIPNSTISHVEVEPIPGFADYAVAGADMYDYILAKQSNDALQVLEIDPNGVIGVVANNTNPTIATLTATGEAYALAKAPLQDRLGSFFHLPGNDGTSGGVFTISNIAPEILNYSVLDACNGQLSPIVKNIVFNDLDNDKVIITNNFTSSAPGVIDPNQITFNQSQLGHWFIGATASSAGTATITFEYTDGLDTLSESISVTVNEPVNANFESTNLEFCINQNEVDFNDFVNVDGGRFNVDGIQTNNGSFNLDTLNITAFPYNANISYLYEDINGCKSNSTAIITVYDAPTANLTVTNTTCGNSDGEITANVNSPNGTYYSYWNTGDQNVLTTSNLSSGTYYFNMIDNKGCVHVAQEDVVASDFAVVGDIVPPTCFNAEDGEISIDVFGGSGNYDVLWSTGHSVETITGLGSGHYQVHVEDTDGCTATQSFLLQNPPKFNVDYTVNKPDCGQQNGSIVMNGSSGGVTPFNYEWLSGETTQDISAIDKGFYQVTVTDLNNCKFKKEFNVNTTGAPMASVENIRKSLCGVANGKIDISLTPATGEFISQVQWSNGAITEDINGLMPGTYECTITQSNGCTAVYQYQVGKARPIKPEICIVSVDTTTNTNLIVWEKPANNPFNIDHYKIYRETANAHEYKVIDTVHHSNISVFNDVVASPANRSWRYRISAVNSCGEESALSKPHKTIHLVVTDVGGGENFVVWDNYQGFQYTSYNLWRYTNDTGWENIEPNIQFNDLPNTTDLPPSTQGLDYVIEVVPPGGTCTATEGKAQDYNSSRSNKPNTVFNPGEGTGDPNNSLAKEENESYSVAVYPNPSDGLLEIAVYQKNSSSKLDLAVMDLNGKVIRENNLNEGVNYLDFSSLDAGIYVLNVSDQNYSETFRIVIK